MTGEGFILLGDALAFIDPVLGDVDLYGQLLAAADVRRGDTALFARAMGSPSSPLRVEAIRAAGEGYCPRLVFTSSIAVFGVGRALVPPAAAVIAAARRLHFPIHDQQPRGAARKESPCTARWPVTA